MAQNYVLLDRITLTASAASVTFSNIPQSGYTDLKIVASLRDTNAGAHIDGGIRLNGATTNYTWRQLRGNGATAASSAGTTDTLIYAWIHDGAGATANTFANCEIYIPNYTSSTAKSVSFDSVDENNGTTAYAVLTAGLWNSTASVTSVDIVTSGTAWAQYSTFSLYGLAATGTTPATAPKASGGDIIKTDGTYWYHTFLTTGAFAPATNLTCDALVVAGGGGAGGYGGGGGGAGGYRTATGLTVTATPYTVIVGSGGASGSGQTAGINGADSTFLTITSTGGGNAGYSGGPSTGGSGGGGFAANSGVGAAGNTPSTSPSQGNNGGNSNQASPNYGTGGGGGAGAVGGVATTTAGGNGGIGSYTAISGGATTGNGVLSGGNYYFAGGGGGSVTFGGTGGTGGTGGGGAGRSGNANTDGGDGTANTGGGGGGGSYYNATTARGGAGGSGIVVIRYAV